ncbi:MAG: hypothetical protein GY862_13200 [Gammaproteobacteria bacterium]|nr:hypothetical protein [Gammaproteobacteria bacterium]
MNHFQNVFKPRQNSGSAVWLLIGALVGVQVHAAMPGLPFSEDFSDTSLRDDARTTADWSVTEQALVLVQQRTPVEVSGIFIGPVIGGGIDEVNALVSGDVDGDGDLDLVMGTFGTDRLYLNNGTANPFSGVVGVAIGAYARQTNTIALGDMDGDGDPDLVAGSIDFPERLYLNNGTADPFNGVTGIDISDSPHWAYDIALGDMDDDGDLDLVTSTGSSSHLYLNNGTVAPFSGVIAIELASSTHNQAGMALEDMDNDGDLDLIAGDALYLNNGSANPFDGVSSIDIGLLSTDSRVENLALGDVDGDGDLDFTIAGYYYASKLHLNNGTANPFADVAVSYIGGGASAIALEDVDGDGDLDLVAGRGYMQTSGIHHNLYLNNGTTDPFNGVNPIRIPADDGTQSILLGDADGDGYPDLIVKAERWQDNGQIVRLYLNNGGNYPFGKTEISTDTEPTVFMALGDLNGDGDLDLMTVNDYNNPAHLYLNNGTAYPFNSVADSDLFLEGASSVTFGDVDSDGDLDLVTGQARLYLNNGTALPFDGVSGLDLFPGSSSSVALGDADGDGDPDIVTVNKLQPCRLYLNNGGSFDGAGGFDIGTDAFDTRAVLLEDVDGDGDLDLATGNYGQPNRLYLNNGTAEPFKGVIGSNITADTHRTLSITAGDADGDGDLDLAAGNDWTDRLYLNNGTAAPFEGISGSDIQSSFSTISATLADTDGDGDFDLHVIGANSIGGRLHLNNGTADPFSGTDIGIPSAEYNQHAVLGDVDGDGDLDRAAGNNGVPNQLYLNRLHEGVPYHSGQGRVVSLPIAAVSVSAAVLTAAASVPPNTRVEYRLSNNGGARWHLVRPGIPFRFPSAGNDLRWRAGLFSLSPVKTPRISRIDISAAPFIVSVTSNTPDGTYGAGEQIDITLNFSEPVTLTGGNLVVKLNNGGIAVLAPFGPAASASGTYTVGEFGESRAALDIHSLPALTENTALRNAAGEDVALGVPKEQTLAGKALIISTLPRAPSNLEAITISHNKIRLAWTDNSDDETGFKIERPAENFVVHVTAANITAHSDFDLRCGTVYEYSVKAVNAAGESSAAALSAATMACLAVSINGNGSVSGNGIDCGSDCSHEDVAGTVITLAALPDTGWLLDRWEGDCGNAGTLTLTGEHACSAVFILDPDFDDDNDGIPSLVEDAAPNNGDGNGDGIPDSEQIDAVSFPSPLTGAYLTLYIPKCTPGSVRVEEERAQPEEDQGYYYPLGVPVFVLDCPWRRVEANVYYHGAVVPSGGACRGYGMREGGWNTLPGALLYTTEIGGQTAALVRFTLSDGEPGDAVEGDGRIDWIGGLAFPVSVLSLSSDIYSIAENAGKAGIGVIRNGGAGAVSVDYTTADDSAKAGLDYVHAEGTLAWADDEQGEQTITFDILDNDLPNTGKTLLVALGNHTTQYAELAVNTAAITILDNDCPPNFLGINSNLPEVLTAACFSGSLRAGADRSGDSLIAGQDDSVEFIARIDADREHAGSAADILLAAQHIHAGIATFYFYDGLAWMPMQQQWTPAEFPVAQTYGALPMFADIAAGLGELAGRPGRFIIYTGYRLADGTVIYNGLGPSHLFVANSSALAPLLTPFTGPSYAYFAGNVKTESGREGNPLEVSPQEIVEISATVQVDTRHVGQTADLLTAAVRTDGGFTFFSQDWNQWGSQLNWPLSPVQAGILLTETVTIPVYQGKLAPGKYTVYAGYRLSDGTIVYNGMETISILCLATAG